MYYGIVLTMGILMGIFAAELDISNKCSPSGEYSSWFFDDVRCQEITTHSTLESAKVQVSAYHAMVRG